MFGRVLHTYFLATRALTLGVRAAVITPDDMFVLVRHSYTPGWHFPGGGLEMNEIASEGLRREIEQEAGISAPLDLSLFGVYFNQAVSKRDHVLLFTCRYSGRIPRKSASLEIAAIRAFGLDDLPSDIDRGTERRMREIQGLEKMDSVW